MYDRALKLKVAVPDPSELWLAVWSMVKRVIVLDEVFMLQITQARITTSIDTRPDTNNVLMLYHMILSEFELKVDVTTEARPGPDGAKEPDKKGKGNDTSKGGKGNGKTKKGDQNVDPSIKTLNPTDKNLSAHQKKELKRLQITRSELPSKGKGKGKGGKNDENRLIHASECANFKKDEGCPYGKACIFFHPQPGKDRCGICNAKDHPTKDCTRPKEPKGKGKS